MSLQIPTSLPHFKALLRRKPRAANNDLTERIVSDFEKQYKDLKNETIVQPNGDLYVTKEVYKDHAREITYAQQLVRDRIGVCTLKPLLGSEFTELQRQEGLSTTRVAKVSDSSAQALMNPRATDVLATSVEKDASDIYIDIVDEDTRISYRIHGMKFPSPGTLTRSEGLDLLRAIWSGTDSSFEEGSACDVGFDFGTMRFRGNSLPAVNGWGAVLRMRDPNFHLPLNKSGYSERQVSAIDYIAQSPGGLIIITGETNSGKSCTLATLMADLPRTQKIVEISDPIEVVFEHVTQIQLNRYASDAEERFNKTLAGLVRQNPDTLILGEIRDEATAKAATSMALQGKRVMSTVHTNSCLLSFSRMADLGVDESLLYQPGFIAGIVNQNLLPVLCPECRQKEYPESGHWDEIKGRHMEMFEGKQWYASGIDCGKHAKCRSGTIGQTLVAEVYPMSYDRDGVLISMIKRDQEKREIDEYVRNTWGMESKQQHAWSKVINGTIDPTHAERTIGRLMKSRDSDYPVAKELS